MQKIYMKCPYNNLLFTDVNQPQLKLQLPMLLDDFVGHIEDHGKDIREAMIEFWLVSIGMKLNDDKCKIQ